MEGVLGCCATEAAPMLVAAEITEPAAGDSNRDELRLRASVSNKRFPPFSLPPSLSLPHARALNNAGCASSFLSHSRDNQLRPAGASTKRGRAARIRLPPVIHGFSRRTRSPGRPDPPTAHRPAPVTPSSPKMCWSGSSRATKARTLQNNIKYTLWNLTCAV